MNIKNTQGAGHQVLGLETAPHLKAKITTPMIMGIVFGSLIPALIVQIYYFGYGVLWQFMIALTTAIICETMVAILRRRNVVIALSDFSYAVTALILALTVPPLLGVYFTMVATAFAIIVVKSVFGGLGQNIFNPAMAGFIFMVISCPSQIGNTWVVPAPAACTVATANQTFEVIFNGKDPVELRNSISSLTLKHYNVDEDNLLTNSDLLTRVDGYSGATYLESIKSARKRGNLDEESPDHEFSHDNYQAYAALAIAYTLGGIVLLSFRIIMFKMVLVFFASFMGLAALMHYLLPGNFMNVTDSVLFGGTMLCAFYIITDPVTNAGTSKGRTIFAILVALLIIFIRAYGSYSDAVAFAVMLGNAFAPLIDVVTKRRPFGVGYKRG